MIDFKTLKEVINIEEVARGFLQLILQRIKMTPFVRSALTVKAQIPEQLSSLPQRACSIALKQKKEVISYLWFPTVTGSVRETQVRHSQRSTMGNSWKEASKSEPKPNAPKEAGTFNPLKYIETLRTEQEDVSEFGIIAELCEEVGGMGLSTKGINRSKLAIPFRKEDGTIVAFIGVSGDVTAPKKWRAA